MENNYTREISLLLFVLTCLAAAAAAVDDDALLVQAKQIINHTWA